MSGSSPTVSHSIRALRQRYSVALLTEEQEHEKRVAALKAKVQVLDELLRDQENGQTVIPAVVSPDKIPDGITEATLWAINKYGRTTSIAIGALKDHMLSAGYKPKGQNFPNTLHTTLKRLVLHDRVAGEKIDGAWRYRAKA